MQWVTAKELKDALGLRRRWGGTGEAQAVCKRSRTGLMQTKAKLFCKGQERLSDALIPVEFWWADGCRCRMHGGNNPGAPVGNRNAWKHGLASVELLTMRKVLRSMRSSLGE